MVGMTESGGQRPRGQSLRVLIKSSVFVYVVVIIVVLVLQSVEELTNCGQFLFLLH